MRQAAILLALALAVVAGPAAAQTDMISARSVVQIRCVTEGGEMKATGFVWPEPGLVVTALHAVAGCASGNGFVYRESARREADITGVRAVSLEGDLALLSLSDDLGLPPVPIAGEPPDARAPHFVWGYPLNAEQVIDLRLDFAGGLNGGTTTLGRAFSSADLTQLFRDQPYPNRDTQILRVTTTIQPGHSGAPIFDAAGRVVAIADGGLLGGWRGINWSIPADIYLPGLPHSTDPIPGGVSQQAQLFSAYAVAEGKSVRVGPAAPAGIDALDEGALTATGRVAVPLVLDALGVETDGGYAWIVDELGAVAPDRGGWDDLGFTAYSNSGWEKPLFAPDGTSLSYDPETGAIDAASAGGNLTQIDHGWTYDSFDAALSMGAGTFLSRLAELGVEGVPDALPDEVVDRDLEYVDYSTYIEGPDGRIVTLAVQVNGSFFSGRAIYAARPFGEMSDAEYVDYLLMELATFKLNDIAMAEPAILGEPSGPGPEPSVLTLVRRVPLADVVQEFVRDGNFQWKRDVAYLKSHLVAPEDFANLAFDVYEDRETGATIAVPEGLALAWQPQMGAVVGETAGGAVQLAVALHRAQSFDAALGPAVEAFVTRLAGLADWHADGPDSCALTVSADEEWADCWYYVQGTDAASGAFADLYLGLTVKGPVFFGTSVYIVGEEEDLTAEEVVLYLMMKIGAEYLSDFAES